MAGDRFSLCAHERHLSLALHAALDECEEWVYGERALPPEATRQTSKHQQSAGERAGSANEVRRHYGTGGPQGGAARPLWAQAKEWRESRTYLRARGTALRRAPAGEGHGGAGQINGEPDQQGGGEETLAEHYDAP